MGEDVWNAHAREDRCKHCDAWQPVFEAMADFRHPEWTCTFGPIMTTLIERKGIPIGCGFGTLVGYLFGYHKTNALAVI